jgi:hypothetical protein
MVNVLLPFVNACGRQRGDDSLCELAEQAYLLVPRLQGNRVLVEAAHRFFVPPSRAATLLRRACDQQGLLEIYRSFCLALHSDCKNCPFVGQFPVALPVHAQYSVDSECIV